MNTWDACRRVEETCCLQFVIFEQLTQANRVSLQRAYHGIFGLTSSHEVLILDFIVIEFFNHDLIRLYRRFGNAEELPRRPVFIRRIAFVVVWSKRHHTILFLRIVQVVHLGLLHELPVALALGKWLIENRLRALPPTILKSVLLGLVESRNQIFALPVRELEAVLVLIYRCLDVVTWVIARVDICVDNLLLRWHLSANCQVCYGYGRHGVDNRNLLFFLLVAWTRRALEEPRHGVSHGALLDIWESVRRIAIAFFVLYLSRITTFLAQVHEWSSSRTSKVSLIWPLLSQFSNK